MSDIDLDAFAQSAFAMMLLDDREGAETILESLDRDQAWMMKEKAEVFYQLCAYISEQKE